MTFLTKIRDSLPGGEASEVEHWFGQSFSRFLVAVAVFPLLVLAVARTTFMLGGQCASWQFWLSVVLTVGLLACGRTVVWRIKGIAVGLFFLFLMAVWTLAPCVVSGGHDNLAYHLPMTWCFVDGWNPLTETTPEALKNAVGLPSEGMWTWHILSVAHPAELFNAVCYFFVRTPLALTYPMVPFLLLPAAAVLWRFFGRLGFGRLCRGLMFAVAGAYALRDNFVFCHVPDMVAGLAGMCVIVTMAEMLVTRRFDRWDVLLYYSLWMMMVKQSALLTCFVFWCLFCVCLAVCFWSSRKQWILRVLLPGGVLALAFLFFSASPYLSSWRTYGHPLYPAYTVDAEKYPAYDITWDFRCRNGDARAMGHVAHFLNAYVSASLVRSYYAWLYHRDAWTPYCRTWRLTNVPTVGRMSPLRPADRLLLLTAVLVLLLWGGRPLRWVLAFLAVGLFCFPTPYVGYLRYAPWVLLLYMTAVGVAVRQIGRSVGEGRMMRWGCIAGIAGCAALGVFHGAKPMAHALAGWQTFSRSSDAVLYFNADSPQFANALRFFVRHQRTLRHAEVRAADTMNRDWQMLIPDYAWFVTQPCTDTVENLFRRASRSPSRLRRYLNYVGMLPRLWLYEFPKTVVARLGMLFRDDAGRD